MQHKRAAGEYTGGIAPYGFRVVDGGRVEAVPHEQAVIAEARRMRDAGVSLRDVSGALADLSQLCSAYAFAFSELVQTKNPFP